MNYTVYPELVVEVKRGDARLSWFLVNMYFFMKHMNEKSERAYQDTSASLH